MVPEFPEREIIFQLIRGTGENGAF